MPGGCGSLDGGQNASTEPWLWAPGVLDLGIQIQNLSSSEFGCTISDKYDTQLGGSPGFMTPAQRVGGGAARRALHISVVRQV